MVESKVAEGFVELSIDTAQFTRGMKGVQKSFTRTLGNIQRGADRAGKALSIALTAPLLAAGIASAKTAGTFEINMAKITGLVGVAADQVDVLGNAVLDLAPQVGKGPVELSQALFTITSAGARGQAALDLLTASAKAATAGLGQTEDVAKATASAMLAFSKDNLTAAGTISTLVNIVKKGNLEGQDLAATFSRVTPFAAALGIALNEAGAAMAVISLTAPNASQAATQLEALFRALNRSTPILEDALDDLGLSFEGVRAQLEQDGLLATLRTLQTRADETGTRLSELFVDSSALAGAMGILNVDAKIVDDTFKALANTTETDLDKAFRAVADTSAFKFTQAMISINTAGTQLGQVILPILAPIITKIAAAVKTAGDAFSDLDPEMQKTILSGLALVAALGPALIIFGLLVGAISTVGGALIALSGVVLSVAGTIIGAFASIPGIIAVTAAAIFLFKDSITESFDDIGIIIEGTFETAFKKAAEFFADFVKKVQGFDFKGFFAGLKDGLAEFGKDVSNFDPLVAGFGLDFKVTPSLDERSIEDINKEIADLIAPRAVEVGPAAGRIKDRFAAEFAEIKADAGTLVDDVITKLGELGQNIPGFDALANKFPEFAAKFGESVAALTGSISENFNTALQNMQTGLNGAGNTIKTISDDIKGILEDVSGTISSSITNVITGATSALDALSKIANQIINQVVSKIIGNIIGSIGGNVASADGNVFSGGNVVPFADGGLISGRTTFGLANGGQGLAGEAGNEAIFPLTRVAGGGLGISAEGVSNDNVVINQINNFQTDVKATVREEIANVAPLIISAAKQATISALNGRRV